MGGWFWLQPVSTRSAAIRSFPRKVTRASGRPGMKPSTSSCTPSSTGSPLAVLTHSALGTRQSAISNQQSAILTPPCPLTSP
jgi:hypothetical protein